MVDLSLGTSGSTSSEEFRFPNSEEIASFRTFALSPLSVDGDSVRCNGIFNGDGVTEEGTFPRRADLSEEVIVGRFSSEFEVFLGDGVVGLVFVATATVL